MLLRDFGKTGVKLSRLGFGAMRLPITKEKGTPLSGAQGIEQSAMVVRYALEKGINYVDSAPYYCHSESETAVGLAIQGWPRERVFLSTKFPVEGACPRCLRLRLELSLRKMRVDYIDFYHFWGINWEGYVNRIAVPEGPMAEAIKAKSEGLIRHISFSFHDKPENAIKLIDTGHFESMLIQYNLLDRGSAEAIAHAHAKGLGVAVMGPVGGGRLGAPSSVISKATGGSTTAEAALRFVWANPNVDVALSGMENTQQVDQNVATAKRMEPLSDAEVVRIDTLAEHNKKLLDLPCTGCGYCTPCPQGVAIPTIFQMHQWHTAFDLKKSAKERYRGLGKDWEEKNKPVTECTECGECEAKCPQKIAIVGKLKEAHAVLTSADDDVEPEGGA
jgi:predicted aldo/keto reductase-like oxidoreductase